jgi:hypothetical protein
VADLTEKLRAKPDDARVAADLVTALLVDVDDAAQAAKYAPAATADPALQRAAALAVKDPSDLSEPEAAELGDWFKSHARGAGKPAALAHARACYERFLALHPKEDVQRLKVKLALDEMGPATAVSAGVKPPASTAAGRVVNLKPLIDPERDGLAGTWRRDKDDIVMESGPRASPLRVPYQPPEEFDLRVEFTRVGEKGGVDLVWTGPDGKPARWKLSTHDAPLDSARHTAVLRVRKNEVTGLLDGKEIARAKPDDQDWTAEAQASVGAGAVGVVCNIGPTRFHAIDLVEVSGKGRPAAHGSADAKDWRVLTWDAPNGKWADAPLDRITVTVKDGVLEARNTAPGKTRAILYYTRGPTDGSLASTFVWSGAAELALRPTDGGDDAIAYTVPDDKWHTARWRRTDGQIGLFVDEEPAQLQGRNHPDGNGSKFLCFELDPNQVVRIKHFALTPRQGG